MKRKSNYCGIGILVINFILIADIIVAALINQSNPGEANNISASVIFYGIFTLVQIPPFVLFNINKFNKSLDLKVALGLWLGIASGLKVGIMFYLEFVLDVLANRYGISKFGVNVYVIYKYLVSAILLLATEITYAVFKCVESKE